MLGSTISIPIMLFIICLVVRIKPMMALKTSFSVGFCIVGMSLLVGRFGQVLVEMASMATAEVEGHALQMADAGRKAAMTLSQYSQVSTSQATEIGIYIMPLAILINLLMLLARCTRTINIDLWSFWLFALTGVLAQSLTGSLAFGLMASAVAVVFTLVVADSSVKGVEKCCAFSGVTFTNVSTAACAPIAGAVCWIVDKIPTKGRKDITFGWLQKRIGYWGDPVLIGTVVTGIFCIASGSAVVSSLQIAVQVGAYIFITPKIMLLLGDAIKPLAIGLDTLSRKKLGLHGSITVGLSSMLGLGNPTAMLFSVLMVPATLWLASVLPNVMFVPSLDLAMLPYLIILVVAICRGGIIRSAISCLISISLMLYSATYLSGLFTQAAVAADAATYGAAGMVSSLYGATPVNWVITQLASFGIAGVGMMVIVILALCLWNYNKLTGNVKIYVKKQRALRTFAIDSIKEEAERRRELRNNAVSKKREDLRKAVEMDRVAREKGLETAPEAVEQLTIFQAGSQTERPQELHPDEPAAQHAPEQEPVGDTTTQPPHSN